MYIIVGLGNPEEDYAKTRHNMGFNTINKLSEQYNIEVKQKKFKALYGTGMIENKKVILLKPQTFMNNSGESIKEIIDFYKAKPEELIVIYDDIDLDAGIVKIRKKGGAGTHNGMKSVVHCIQSEDFIRVRVGIGKPEHKGDLINYVIGAIPEEEVKILDEAATKAKEGVIEILKNGVDNAMNKIN